MKTKDKTTISFVVASVVLTATSILMARYVTFHTPERTAYESVVMAYAIAYAVISMVAVIGAIINHFDTQE